MNEKLTSARLPKPGKRLTLATAGAVHCYREMWLARTLAGERRWATRLHAALEELSPQESANYYAAIDAARQQMGPWQPKR